MKAEIKTEVIKKMVEVEQKEEMIVLTFTKKEAEVVKDLFGSIAGGSKVRQFTSSVYFALNNLGVRSKDCFIGTLDVEESNKFGEE